MFKIALRDVVLVLGIFCVSFYFQHAVWTMRGDVVDSWIWGHAVEKASHDLMYEPTTGEEISSGAYGYPATTLVIPAAMLVRHGVSPRAAMLDVLSFSIAFGIAAIAWICMRLRPQSYWWAGTTVLLLFNDLYYIATPPSSMIMVSVPFVMLCAWYIFEEQGESRAMQTVLGIATGYAIATRFDIPILVSISVCVFLVVQLRKLPWVYMGVGIVSFILFDPHVVVSPIEHFAAFFYRSLYTQGPHIFSLATGIFSSPTLVIAEAAPLAMLALIGSCVTAWMGRGLFARRSIVTWLIGTTVAITVLLFFLPTHAQWYFFPLFTLWEVVLPLGMWSALQGVKGISLQSQMMYAAVLCTGLLFVQVGLFFNIMLV